MQDNNEILNNRISDVEISTEMKRSYIDYAMSVIVARALPDVRDGLKPVHRRILYAMSELGLEPNKAYKKSARIVGDTMGKYHPHGDSAIYDALVRLAQDFSMRYTLVDGHGNFGSIDGYPAAASRYTEAKFSKISMEMIADIDKNTVDFVDNYDGEFKEPSVLPSRFPNLLVNGAAGIAVGMATNIPPHNLGEVIDGIVRIIDNKVNENRETDIDELIEIIKGPDFPTGATILGQMGIQSAYRTGKGKIRLRSTAEIETMPNGRERIIVTEIPYQVNKSRMIERIAELVRDKKIEGISKLDDLSEKDKIAIIFECKKDVSAQVVLNQLYKYSQLQETYSINFLAIVDGVPRVLNLKEMLEYYLEYQVEVITRRTKFDLDKALKRMHILEGYILALDNIDEVISILRSSQTTAEAKERLTDRFGFTELQVNAICEMRFRSLIGMEREKLNNEYSDLKQLTERLNEILADEKVLYGVIREEITQIRNKYADERRTQLVQDLGEFDIEDLIEDEMSVITMTRLNYVKRIPLDTYKSQKRGGKGIIGLDIREEDLVKDLFLSSNHSLILFFTNFGKVYKLKTWQIPEAGRNAKGTPIINLLQLDEGETISAVIPVRADAEREDKLLVMVTKHGIIKKTPASMFGNIRKGGLIAVGLKDGDELISVMETDGTKDIFVVTKKGMAIRFDENDFRALSRTATGVKAITLNPDDVVIGAEILRKDANSKILIASEKGFGKCTESDSFKLQHRGGKGLKSYKITEKTGDLVGLNIVDDKEELMLMTSQGIIIRIRVKDISTVGRVTQGVKLINLPENVKVVSIAKIASDYIEDNDDEDEILPE